MPAIPDYLDSLKANLAHGDATEHTHRPALKTLLDALSGKGITATNEPKRIACGAPDFNITKGKTPLGHLETKDIGVNLDEIEHGTYDDVQHYQRILAAAHETLGLMKAVDAVVERSMVAGRLRA